MEMNHEYASKGVAGAALGTGVAGLSLGVLNAVPSIMSAVSGAANKSSAASNDILTALLTADMVRGRSGGSGGGDCDPVTQREMKLVQQLAEKDTQIALRDANTFTDQKSIELYRYIDGKFVEVEKQLSAQAVRNQAVTDSIQLVQERLECAQKTLETAIKAEAKERRCNDTTIINYVNSTFYPQSVADVTTGTTATAKSTYNPLPVCSCDC